MGIAFFSDDTQIRTTEEQDYKRTVYLLAHNVTLISILLLQIYIDFFIGITFFPDDTQTRTTEDQAYMQTAYLLDHSVTLISILFLQIKLRNKYQVPFQKDHFFFPVSPRLEPPKTKLTSGQSIY